ncbi:hypothetical protein PCANC_03857 [Puccinia coronata f. sp. avenae]|uniref:RING-CH-type domain-containing protein n=1 Tax=Puccinia coronata f. sp. avenae TaxID=200324 RepID=A0A2N5T7C2_9BASI|nr:hypothetical protein PCANC_03857 [Puccinia coronata f. sp. avenae]
MLPSAEQCVFGGFPGKLPPGLYPVKKHPTKLELHAASTWNFLSTTSQEEQPPRMNSNSAVSHIGKNKQPQQEDARNSAAATPTSELAAGFPDDFPHASRPAHASPADLSTPASATPPPPPPLIPNPLPAARPATPALMFHGSTARTPREPPAGRSANQHRTSTHLPRRNYAVIQKATFSPANQCQPPKPEPRKCWICYDDDDEEAEEQNPQVLPDGRLNRPNQQIRSNRKSKRWVKACRCSLIAHESCLLTWITTYQLTHPAPASISSPLLTPVKCPQCAAIYQIAQPPSPLLSLLHRLKRPYNASMSWSALGCVVLGVGVSASSYGLWASRCFLGPVRWDRWVSNTRQAGGLNFLKFFQLSLVGPILILSRTKQLDSVLPFLPISFVLSTLHPLSLDGDLNNHINNHLADQNLLRLEHVFPPEPGLTLCLIPWMRIGWRFLWSRLSSFILRREYRGMSYQYPLGVGLGLQQAQAVAGADPNAGHQVEGENEDQRDGAERPEEGAPNGPDPPAAEIVLDNTSLRRVIRIGMEALILPGAASVVGTLLLMLSRNRPWLRTLLGLKISTSLLTHRSPFSHPLGSSPSSTASFLASLKASVGQMMYRMTRLQLFFGPAEAGADMHPLKLHSLLSGMSVADYVDENGVDDPVWWRNTLAGALIIVLKDLVSLTEKVLKLRKLKYRRVLDVDQHPIR